MRIFKYIIALTVLLSLICCVGINSCAESPYPTYTYWNLADGSTVARPVKDMYYVSKTIDYNVLQTNDIQKIEDVCTDGNNNIYILDGKGSAVFILDEKYKLKNTIRSIVIEGKPETFSDAQGLFVDNNGLLWLSDTKNERVVCMDAKGYANFILTLPSSSVIPDDFLFKPIRVTVDSDGYIYVLSDGSYYGAILYSPQREFLGFFGSNKVNNSFLDALDKFVNRLTMTNKKRARTASKLPFQISDIYIDKYNFVYTATGAGTTTASIKRYNRGGDNVLDEGVSFGDNKVISITVGSNQEKRTSDFLGVATDSNNFIYALDSTYGRVFIYNNECSMICAFGAGLSLGEQAGTFKGACAIDISRDGDNILVADSTKNTVTVFSVTEYGKAVKKGCLLTTSGDYEQAEKIWNAILKEDRNCQVAYSGIASAKYITKDYKGALEYAKLGMNKEIYSEAKAKQLNETLKNNFYYIACFILLLVVFFVIFKKRISGFFTKKLSNKYVKTYSSVFIHPFYAFEDVKLKQQGSLIISAVLVLLYYIVTILETTASGFAFSTYEVTNFNSIFVLTRTVGLVLLWAVSNWAISQLLSGLATFKEEIIVISYALTPVIIAKAINTLLTHFIPLSGNVFLNIITVLSLIYTAFLLIVGTMRINDYSFKKFVGTTIVTVLMMMLIVFLLFILIILAQQFFGFLRTVYTECVYY